jgi:hypothetical protein
MNAAAEYIREAIRNEEYQKALAQWHGYASHLREAVEAHTLPPNQMEEARALFEWSRGMLLGARARLREQYGQIEVAAAYSRRPAARPGLLDTRF